MIGQTIAHYRITAKLGEGGMGEVYRATDTKLDREVALKILPATFAQDPDRMARFEREAKVLASLNHPNIAQIYGVEERALMMELVEGVEPKGPMAFDEAWKIASQIVAALEYAHDKGIVHRDLKPANIKVTADGAVKLLDFGLAKAFTEKKEPSANPEHSPTLTIGATEVGVILGTAAYMSPEQAKGKSVDKRADIWAFGVALYELLTGERPFKGDDISETLVSVLRDEPDLGKVPPKTRKLLRRCLEKDPKQRLRDIGEARFLLEDGPVETKRPSPMPWAIAVLTTLLALIGLLGWWRATRHPEPAPRPLVRLDVDLGPDVSLGSPFGADVIISPDGSRLAFVSKNRLFTRRLDQPTAKELAGTEGAATPFFSPDGQWVAFLAGGKLKKISVEGGAAIALCDAQALRGGSWGDDGNIIAALTISGPLSRIPSAGGAPTPVTELVQGEVTHRFPQILPGNQAVLFTSHTTITGFDSAKIEVMFFKDHRRQTIHRGGMYGRYLATSNGYGHLTYVNQGTLFAVPFDLNKLEQLGAPSPLLEQVSAYASGFAQLDISRTGTLVYRPGAGQGLVKLGWLDETGKTEALPAKPGAYSQPILSPDGRLLALTVSSGSGSDIWVYDWQRDAMTPLTFGEGAFNFPAWSPDGRYVVFRTEAGGMLWTRGDGGSKPQPLTQTRNSQYPWSFSPDGKRLAFAEQRSASGLDIITVGIDNDAGQLRAGEPEAFLQTPSSEMYPAFSPDGHWIGYRSYESGQSEIYVRAFPNTGGKWLISNGGGHNAAWSRNGRELFYRTDDQRIMVVTYTVKDSSFVPDKPRQWSERRLADTGIGRNFDVAPDGKRLLVLLPAEGAEATNARNHVTFLLNFFDELKRRAPVTK